MTPRRRVPIRVRQHDQQGGTGAIHAALATPAVATTPEQPTTARPARAEGRLNQQVHIDARQRIRIFAEDYFPVPPVLPAQPLQSATPAVATNQTTAIELDPDAEYYPYGLLPCRPLLIQYVLLMAILMKKQPLNSGFERDRLGRMQIRLFLVL